MNKVEQTKSKGLSTTDASETEGTYSGQATLGRRQKMVNELRDGIVRGDISEGSMLPTEAELMKSHGLSRHSVRVALDELVGENLIERTRGKGTVVCSANRRTKPKTIAFLAQDPSEWLAAGIASGLQEGLGQRETRLELVAAGDTQEEFYEAVEDLLCHRPDGVVVLPLPWITNHEWVFRFRQEKLPAVVLDSYPVGTEIDSVEMDNKMSGYLSGRHLIEQGYKRLYYLTFESQSNTNKNRLDGFLQAVTEARAEVESCIPIQYSLDSEAKADHRHPWKAAEHFWLDYCGSLLEAGMQFPIGVAACNDNEAYGVAAACRKLGLKVGKDVGILGVDDRDIAVLCDPPLTTLHHSPKEIGKKAAELLGRRLQDRHCEYEHVYIEPKLVVRESAVITPQK